MKQATEWEKLAFTWEELPPLTKRQWITARKMLKDIESQRDLDIMWEEGITALKKMDAPQRATLFHDAKQVYRTHRGTGLLFLQQAPIFLEEYPQQYPRYASIALTLTERGTKPAIQKDKLRHQYFVPKPEAGYFLRDTKIALKGFAEVDKNRLLDDVATIAQDTGVKDVYSAITFLRAGPLILKEYPDLYTSYVQTGISLLKKDNQCGKTFLGFAPRAMKGTGTQHQPPILQALGRIAQQGPEEEITSFAYRVPRMMDALKDKPVITPEDCLLEYVHDLQSAGIVSKIIDKSKYGKEYAQKCGQFY